MCWRCGHFALVKPPSSISKSGLRTELMIFSCPIQLDILSGSLLEILTLLALQTRNDTSLHSSAQTKTCQCEHTSGSKPSRKC